MKQGSICSEENLLNHVCYEIGVKDLIDQGFLSPLTTKASKAEVDTSELHIRAGEYKSDEVEALMDRKDLVSKTCIEILECTKTRRSVLIFCAGVNHGKHIAESLQQRTEDRVETIFGETLGFERQEHIDDFKTGKIKFLVNMNVLTTGFDAPNVDCVILLRPTASPGLYYQMVGRGFRLYETKADCLVLDFANNVMRHGPVDAVKVEEAMGGGGGEAPMKICPECRAIILAGLMTCPNCEYPFPKDEEEKDKHESKASEAPILSGQITVDEYEVRDTVFAVHVKKNADMDAPRTLKVTYMYGLYQKISEWVCIEHSGFARRKAISWWKQRTDCPVPKNIEDAVKLCQHGFLAVTNKIKVQNTAGEKYDQVVGGELGPKPPAPEPGSFDGMEEEVSVGQSWYDHIDNEEIPF